MNEPEAAARHPIRVVAQRTGLTTATIRAWERRYGAVTPERSDGGQRLYSDRDVTRLGALRALTEAGRPISMVAGLSDEEIKDLLREDRDSRSAAGESSNGQDPRRIVEQAYRHVVDLDPRALEQTLWHAAVSLEGWTFLQQVAGPMLTRIGAGWAAGELDPGQEHAATDVLDKTLSYLIDPSRWPDGPGLVVATLPGERHGLGARLVSAAATIAGWRVTYLGTDLPVADIVSAVSAVGASAVAISVVGQDSPEETMRHLTLLRRGVDRGVVILVGGRGAPLLDWEGLPDGVELLEGLDALRSLERTGH